jgi:putative acetyltransferase
MTDVDDHVVVRPERPGDTAGVHAVHVAAFTTDAEARLVAALRAAGRLRVSLVACAGGRVIGHVAYSPLDRQGGLGLAPLAVLPAWQRRGVGGVLARAGLEAARAAGAGFVVVLGSPAYYGRFGFGPASRHGLRDAYGGGDAFQVLELQPGALPAGAGLVAYAPEFAALEDHA